MNIKLKSSESYKIDNGVLNFLNDNNNYSNSFGIQWKIWPLIQFDRFAGISYSEDMFKRITGIDSLTELSGLTVLDIGCGPGRFIDICRKYGAKVWGVDYSDAAYIAAKNFSSDNDVTIIRCSATNLPIESSQFDLVYSIGVLHHTDCPDVAFSECARVCKKGGRVAISVYGKNGYYDLPHLNLIRRFLNLLGEKTKKYIALLYSVTVVSIFYPLHRLFKNQTRILRAIVPHAYINNYVWSILDTYDSITPKYQHTYYSYEIYDWYLTNNFINIIPTKWHSAAMVGEKNN